MQNLLGFGRALRAFGKRPRRPERLVERGGNSINPASHALNLMVTFDADFHFQLQINNTVKSCNCYIRDITRLCKHLSLHATIALANALVSSRFNYCKSLLHSANVTYLDKLQRVQNSLTRVVTKSTRLSPSKPLLINLHWLPIYSRINL